MRIKRTFVRRQGQKEKQKGGRPRKLSNRDKRALIRALLWLRENEGRYTIKRVMEQAGFTEAHLSERSVSRYLNSQGYFSLQARKKGLMSRMDLKKRLAFAKKMSREYARFVWTNEVCFYLDGTSFEFKTNPLSQARAPKGRVWRKKSEGMLLG